MAQANGEIESQKQVTPLKKNAQGTGGGKGLERGSHEISGCPSEHASPKYRYAHQSCFFERKLGAKSPSLREVAKVDEEVRDRDRDIKGHGEEVYGRNV